jgi:Tfp pilus assembly protein PilF
MDENYHFVAYLNRGISLIKLNDVKEGEKDLQMAIKINPQSSSALYELAMVYQGRKNCKEKYNYYLGKFRSVLRVDTQNKTKLRFDELTGLLT